ncbi:Tyrosine-protein kinase FRK [Orchesella cincta]|uniref:Tyrosine-protein kinase FRK n=1 Tax=Orchesella cincta TaxID=48709 RepID=A0A1D2MKD9_ORCCI|nr:Tyrosine-protein kinase FRK [Orchesella cincta]
MFYDRKDIMKKCWRKTPRKRPKFCAIHYKLKKYNNPEDRIDQLRATADTVGSSNNDDQLPVNYSRLGETESDGRTEGVEMENFDENGMEEGDEESIGNVDGQGEESSPENKEQGEGPDRTRVFPEYVTASDLETISSI